MVTASFGCYALRGTDRTLIFYARGPPGPGPGAVTLIKFVVESAAVGIVTPGRSGRRAQ